MPYPITMHPGWIKWSLGQAPPTTGEHFEGEIVFNTLPSTGDFAWVCTVYGSDGGTWVAVRTGDTHTNLTMTNVNGVVHAVPTRHSLVTQGNFLM